MSSDALFISTVAGSGALSAAVDLRTRRVPNWLTVAITSLGVGLAATHLTATSLTGALAGFALGLVLMLPGHIVGATGAGDVKLFAAVGTLLGPSRIGIAFAYTAIFGGVLAVAVALHRGRLRQTFEDTSVFLRTGGANVAQIEARTTDNRFAYAPAIALGALAAAIRF